MLASVAADTFAEALNEKFKNESEYSSKVFTVKPGRTYDRVLQGREGEGMHTIHAFVERKTGAVFKAATYRAPAKGVRFENVEKAIEKADLYGSYLYLR